MISKTAFLKILIFSSLITYVFDGIDGSLEQTIIIIILLSTN